MCAYHRIEQQNPIATADTGLWPEIAVANQAPKLQEVAIQVQQQQQQQQPERLTPAEMAAALRRAIMAQDFGPNSEVARQLQRQLHLAYQAGAANGGGTAGGEAAFQRYVGDIDSAGVYLRVTSVPEHADRIRRAFRDLGLTEPSYVQRVELCDTDGQPVGNPLTVIVQR